MADCMSCGYSQNRTGAKHCGNCGARLSFLAPGEVLHQRYKIISLLGKGGMGAVCLVEDQNAFGKRCVVKELIDYFNPGDPVEVAKAKQRFEDEARTLGSLDHPSIPNVREYFSDAGRNYLVMDFVEGENLQDRLLREGKALPHDEVLQYAVQICRVLEYLATRNPPLVHHDIKPANIIVNREAKTVSLVDFGTAKVRFAQGGGTLGQGQSSVYGTIGYAPPEQYGDHPQTEPRSDVHALGATIYHLLTADDPGDHPMSYLMLPTLAIATRQALERALEPKVARRATAVEFRAALEKVLAPRPTVQPYVFPSGDKAQSAEELAQLCDRNWREARELLHRNSFEPWLRTNLFRSDLAQAAGRLSGQADKDIALEAFTHVLDPNLPNAMPQLDQAQLNFGTVKADRRITRQLRITNSSPRGHLSGAVTIQPESHWLAISPTSFSGNDTAFTISMDTSGLAQGSRLAAELVVDTPHAPQVSVRVQSRVELAWAAFLGTWALFILVGALLGAGASWLAGQIITRGFAGNLETYWLIAIGSLTLAAAIGLGVALGAPDRFSRFGLILGVLIGLPMASYLLFAMLAEHQVLETARNDWLTAGVTAGIIIVPALLLGLFAGLRKIRRKGLAILLPVVLVAALYMGVTRTPALRLGTTPFYMLGNQVPVVYVGLARNAPTEPTPTIPELSPLISTLGPTHVPEARPTSTPTLTSGRTVAPQTTAAAGIRIGGKVRVANTQGRGIRVRAEADTSARVVTSLIENVVLEVIGGPKTSDGYIWWQVKRDKTVGWAAQNWLVPVK